MVGYRAPSLIFFQFVWTEHYRIQTLWSSRPLDKGEPGLQKSLFSGLSLVEGFRPPPPAPSPGSATAEFKLRSKNTWSKTEANTHPPSLRSRSYGDKLSQERASLFQPSQLWLAYIWEKRWLLCPSQKVTSALAHVLIVSENSDQARRVTHLVEPPFCCA